VHLSLFFWCSFRIEVGRPVLVGKLWPYDDSRSSLNQPHDLHVYSGLKCTGRLKTRKPFAMPRSTTAMTRERSSRDQRRTPRGGGRHARFTFIALATLASGGYTGAL
jgi:hypothetical protein